MDEKNYKRFHVAAAVATVLGVVIAFGSAVWAACSASRVHRDNQASADRNLDLVERQLAILEVESERARDRLAKPRIVLHVNERGEPCVSNLGEVGAKSVFLNFETKPGPTGSFCFQSGQVVVPDREIVLKGLC